FDKLGEARPPAWLEAHDVVGEPDVVRLVLFLQPFYFGDDVFWRAGIITLSPDRFGAPVAVVGTAASGDHVHGVVAVSLLPDAAIPFDIDEIPGGEGEHLEVLDVGAARVAAPLTR